MAPSTQRTRNGRALGFTLLELLVVLSILSVGFSLSAVAVRPPAAQTYATSLRNLVLQARFEAIRRHEPVVVAWDASAAEFVVRVAGSTNWCQDMGVELRRSNAADVGRLSITTTVVGNGSLVWIPSGQARNCARASFAEDFADVDDGRVSRRVLIGAAGRVEVQ